MNHRPDRPFSPCRKPHGLSCFPAPLFLKDSHQTYQHHPLFIHLSQQCEGTLLVIIKSLQRCIYGALTQQQVAVCNAPHFHHFLSLTGSYREQVAISTLRMRKLRLQWFNWCHQDHTAGSTRTGTDSRSI